MCKKLIFSKHVLFVNRSNYQFYLFFPKKKSDCRTIYTHTHISIKNKKITFSDNVKKIKNILIKGGGYKNLGPDKRSLLLCILLLKLPT